jgi:CheY-like chemotaxis protein
MSEPLRVLVVDDDLFWAEIIAAMCAERATEVVVCHSIEKAWAQVTENGPFAIAFVDLTLSDSSPGQTIRRIADFIRLGCKRVIAITGSVVVTESLRDKIMESGAEALVGKDCKDMPAEIRRLMNEPPASVPAPRL